MDGTLAHVAAPPPARPPDPGHGAPPGPVLPPLRPRQRGFSPTFTLSIVYVAALWIVFSLLLALPDLLAGARALPPGPAELTPAELAQAREIARAAVSGRLHYALAAALATFGALVWLNWLPGVRRR